MTEICDVCCEKYNQSIRKQVKCPFGDCEFSACKTCIRTYLLRTTADPHCMNCKKGWDEKFIVANLNRIFCEKEYKVHRKTLLIDREISRLPETIHLAERQKKIDIEEQKSKAITLQIQDLTKTLNSLKFQRVHLNNNIYHIRTGTDENGTAPERRKFIMACPNTDCRGYLSTQYKCELCELFTCPQCLELIGYSKNDPHECDPNSVASAEMIKKDTKPCPSCGVRIFKISGCDQMWCTECKVAFDYNTGTIDTGTVHNPHYYAHMAQQNNGVAPRNPHDVVCGGLVDLRGLHNQIFNKIKQAITDKDESHVLIVYLESIHRVISHITFLDLPRIRFAVRELTNTEDLRVQYILGKLDKKEMGRKIYGKDIKRKKEIELLHLYELLSVVGIENFNTIYQSARNLPNLICVAAGNAFLEEVNSKITILNNLREYCNNELAKISVTYNNKVLYLTNLWEIKSKKYNISELKA